MKTFISFLASNYNLSQTCRTIPLMAIEGALHHPFTQFDYHGALWKAMILRAQA